MRKRRIEKSNVLHVSVEGGAREGIAKNSNESE